MTDITSKVLTHQDHVHPAPEVLAAAINAASVLVGQVRISNTLSPTLVDSGQIVARIAKEIIKELRKDTVYEDE